VSQEGDLPSTNAEGLSATGRTTFPLGLPPINVAQRQMGAYMAEADFNDVTNTDLIKQINTAYESILSNERSTLQKAIPIGQMLIELKPRVAKHGAWQEWVKINLPKMSYETVSLYMRLADPENLAKLLAVGKSATIADLRMTITEAAKAIAKPKSDAPKGAGKGKSQSPAKGAVEPANAPRSISADPQAVVRDIEPGDLFDILKSVWDTDALNELKTKLTAHLLKLEQYARLTPPNERASDPALRRM
jgi:hypothetical protein